MQFSSLSSEKHSQILWNFRIGKLKNMENRPTHIPGFCGGKINSLAPERVKEAAENTRSTLYLQKSGFKWQKYNNQKWQNRGQWPNVKCSKC